MSWTSSSSSHQDKLRTLGGRVKGVLSNGGNHQVHPDPLMKLSTESRTMCCMPHVVMLWSAQHHSGSSANHEPSQVSGGDYLYIGNMRNKETRIPQRRKHQSLDMRESIGQMTYFLQTWNDIQKVKGGGVWLENKNVLRNVTKSKWTLFVSYCKQTNF